MSKSKREQAPQSERNGLLIALNRVRAPFRIGHRPSDGAEVVRVNPYAGPIYAGRKPGPNPPKTSEVFLTKRGRRIEAKAAKTAPWVPPTQRAGAA